MKAPNRWSKKTEHNKYGIIKWFRVRHEITMQGEITAFVNLFCKLHDYNNPKISKMDFCQNRFIQFSKFVNKKIKTIENLEKQPI